MAYPHYGYGYSNMTVNPTNTVYGDDAMDAQSEDGFEDAQEHLPTEDQQTYAAANNSFQDPLHSTIEQAGIKWQQPVPPNFRQYGDEAQGEVGNEQVQGQVHEQIHEQDHEQVREQKRPARTRYKPADDPPEVKIEKENHRTSYSDAYHRALNKSAHAPGCTGEQIPNTPPATPQFGASLFPTTTAQQPPAIFVPQQEVWQGPNIDGDLSKTFTKYREFQSKARLLRPQTFLPPHRYWIGVLLPGIRPNNLNREDQLMWFKGNRFTTVETIWNIFGTRFVKEEFVLMLGAERLEMDVKMGECDLVNDKIVILRYLDEEDPQAKGREVSGALVPREIEVIDLD